MYTVRETGKKDLVILVGLSGSVSDVTMCIQQQTETTEGGLRDLGSRVAEKRTNILECR